MRRASAIRPSDARIVGKRREIVEVIREGGTDERQ
jgi:hypothetical protein